MFLCYSMDEVPKPCPLLLCWKLYMNGIVFGTKGWEFFFFFFSNGNRGLEI